MPRWLAILLVYIVVVLLFVLVVLLVIPPLVTQATTMWEKAPDEFARVQRFLIRYKLLRRPLTLAEAVQSAPSGSSANAVGTVLFALSSFAGGIFGLITILILSYYFLLEARAMFEYIIRFVPVAQRAARGDSGE